MDATRRIEKEEILNWKKERLSSCMPQSDVAEKDSGQHAVMWNFGAIMDCDSCLGFGFA